MNVERVCQEVGELLRKDFSNAGYFNRPPDVVFYAVITDDILSYESVNFHVEDLIGMNKHEILDRIYTYWL